MVRAPFQDDETNFCEELESQINYFYHQEARCSQILSFLHQDAPCPLSVEIPESSFEYVQMILGGQGILLGWYNKLLLNT